MPFPPPFSTSPQRINHAPFRPHARRFTVLTAALAAAMLDCTNAEIDRQEVRMHAALAKLIAQNPKKATQIKREQAQWQQKMKRAAKKEYTRTGGTMDLLNGSGLVLDMTEKRADALEKRLAK